MNLSIGQMKDLDCGHQAAFRASSGVGVAGEVYSAIPPPPPPPPFQVIHYTQMFDNIAKLRFEQGPNQEPLANAMISSEGEMMEYRQGIAAEGKVEDWMTLVLNEMRRTNQLLTKESIFHYCESKTR